MTEDKYIQICKDCHLEEWTYPIYLASKQIPNFFELENKLGYANGFVMENGHIFLNTLWIEPTKRNNGGGTQIMKQLLEQANKIECVVNDDSKAMITILEKLGFIGSRHCTTLDMNVTFENEKHYIWEKK